MHNFEKDFYGYEMRAVVLGYIRPELDYVARGMSLPTYHQTTSTHIILQTPSLRTSKSTNALR